MEEFYLDSCGAGRLHCALWKPEGEPKAVVQLIHGIAEHIGRYDAFAKFLTQHGYVVAADDHMGHGGSAENGLRGYFSGGWLSAVEDEKRLHDEISAQYPDLPYYILGHSMGSFYAQKALGIESPRVGLLNNGAEDTKGDPLHREAHQLLKRAAEQGTIHFVGNVEARDVPFGAADVIVADGFSGNVLLKTMEGTAMFMSDMMKQMFYRNPLTMLGALLCKKGINGIRKTMDYRETGGSIVIGISRPVIKAHGSSDDAAIRGAIRQAIRAVESGFCEEIRANIGQMILPREEEHAE